jgi:hypothetical protein
MSGTTSPLRASASRLASADTKTEPATNRKGDGERNPSATSTAFQPLLIDHRGDQSIAPDNSETAVLSSLGHRPVDGVNIDLRACQDGIYLAHDNENLVMRADGSETKGNARDLELVALDQCTLTQLAEYRIVYKDRPQWKPERLCTWKDVVQWIKNNPRQVFWLDLKDGPYRPVTKGSTCDDCCFSACLYCCGCWCSCGTSEKTLVKHLHPLVVAVVYGMKNDLTDAELKRCIVTSTNPFLMIEWIRYGSKFDLPSRVASYGFDYGNQSKWLYELSMDTMILEQEYRTTMVAMGANLMTDEKRMRYHAQHILTAIYQDGFTTDRLPTTSSDHFVIVESLPPAPSSSSASSSSSSSFSATLAHPPPPPSAIPAFSAAFLATAPPASTATATSTVSSAVPLPATATATATSTVSPAVPVPVPVPVPVVAATASATLTVLPPSKPLLGSHDDSSTL